MDTEREAALGLLGLFGARRGDGDCPPSRERERERDRDIWGSASGRDGYAERERENGVYPGVGGMERERDLERERERERPGSSSSARKGFHLHDILADDSTSSRIPSTSHSHSHFPPPTTTHTLPSRQISQVGPVRERGSSFSLLQSHSHPPSHLQYRERELPLPRPSSSSSSSSSYPPPHTHMRLDTISPPVLSFRDGEREREGVREMVSPVTSSSRSGAGVGISPVLAHRSHPNPNPPPLPHPHINSHPHPPHTHQPTHSHSHSLSHPTSNRLPNLGVLRTNTVSPPIPVRRVATTSPLARNFVYPTDERRLGAGIDDRRVFVEERERERERRPPSTANALGLKGLADIALSPQMGRSGVGLWGDVGRERERVGERAVENSPPLHTRPHPHAQQQRGRSVSSARPPSSSGILNSSTPTPTPISQTHSRTPSYSSISGSAPPFHPVSHPVNSSTSMSASAPTPGSVNTNRRPNITHSTSTHSTSSTTSTHRPTNPTRRSPLKTTKNPQAEEGSVHCLCGFDHDDGSWIGCEDCARCVFFMLFDGFWLGEGRSFSFWPSFSRSNIVTFFFLGSPFLACAYGSLPRWSHTACFGIEIGSSTEPEEWRCWECSPGDYGGRLLRPHEYLKPSDPGFNDLVTDPDNPGYSGKGGGVMLVKARKTGRVWEEGVWVSKRRRDAKEFMEAKMRQLSESLFSKTSWNCTDHFSFFRLCYKRSGVDAWGRKTKSRGTSDRTCEEEASESGDACRSCGSSSPQSTCIFESPDSPEGATAAAAAGVWKSFGEAGFVVFSAECQSVIGDGRDGGREGTGEGTGTGTRQKAIFDKRSSPSESHASSHP